MAYALEHGAVESQGPKPLHAVESPPEPSVSQFEITDILVKLQRFVDETARQAEQEAQAIVRAAHFEAYRLVEEAKQQAAGMTAHATETANPAPVQSPVAGEAIAQLSAAIEEFAGSNNALVQQLARLRDTLSAPPPVTALSSTAYPSIPPPPPPPPSIG